MSDNNKPQTSDSSDKKAPRTQRRLTLGQYVQLTDMLRAQRDKFAQEMVTLDEAAQYLTHRLGFEVTDHQVAAARKALGFTWTSKTSEKGRKTKGLRSVMRRLAAAVTGLQQALGLEVDEVLVKYAAGEVTGAEAQRKQAEEKPEPSKQPEPEKKPEAKQADSNDTFRSNIRVVPPTPAKK